MIGSPARSNSSTAAGESFCSLALSAGVILYLQLRDFEKGERKSELMSPIAHAVVKDDALDLAKYFAAKEWPRTNAPRAV